MIRASDICLCDVCDVPVYRSLFCIPPSPPSPPPSWDERKTSIEGSRIIWSAMHCTCFPTLQTKEFQDFFFLDRWRWSFREWKNRQFSMPFCKFIATLLGDHSLVHYHPFNFIVLPKIAIKRHGERFYCTPSFCTVCAWCAWWCLG